MASTCLDDQILARLCTDGLDVAERDRVEEHLAACAACRVLVSAILRSSDGAADSQSRIETIGRYLPIAMLGKGGMGQVYRAYDPSLEREVALKLVSLAAFREERAQVARTRLLREAQALAQLSHPAIVTVYDVGAVPDHVFVAMELIRGQTLRAWLGTGPRPKQILEAFCRAGEALAAAHRVRIIHRDFKPENVMVTDEGQVKVLDFGLAGAAGELEDPGATPLPALSHTRLTVTGALIGTPAYMSPEQLRREPASPRSDQWSFCVALYEALFGERPFPADTLPGLLETVQRGLAKMPPRPDGVPTRVLRTLERGLSLAPANRFDSMDELLDGLRPRVSRKNRMLAAAFGATALVFSTAMFMKNAAPEVDCDAGEDRMAQVWDDASWNALHENLVARGLGNHSDIVRRLRQGLDDYADRWVAMHGDACRATHEHGTQSPQLLDIRMECLDRRLREFSAFVGGLVHSRDRERLLSSSFGVSRLGGLDSCAEHAHTDIPPLPQDPLVREKITALQKRLDALVGRGEFLPPADRRKEADYLVAQARPLGYEPLTAQALFQQGLAALGGGNQKEAGEIFQIGAAIAAEAKDDALLARHWVALINSLERQSRYEQVLALEPVAQAAILRAGENPYLSAELSSAIGWALIDLGRYEEAHARFQKAYDATNDHRHDHDLARALYGRGITLRELGRYDAAATDLERSIALSKKTVGADHPSVAMSMTHLGRVRVSQRRMADAQKTYEGALAVMAAVLESNHPKIGYPHLGLAELYLEAGNPDAAEKGLDAAVAIWRKTYPPTHHEFGLVTWFRGRVAAQRGRHGEALNLYREASTLLHETLGKNHPLLAQIHRDLAASYLESGDLTLAQTEADTALRTYPIHGREASRLEEIKLLHARVRRAAGPSTKASPTTAPPATTRVPAASAAPREPGLPRTNSPATLPPAGAPARH